MFKDQKVLITGGTGMIGRSLAQLLHKRGAKITVADVRKPTVWDLPPDIEFEQVDLRDFGKCLTLCKGMDYVFHLAGVKGSPKRTLEQPADFFVPMLQFNTNMMEAARWADVKWYLFTSSVGVYSPASVFYEDDVWSTFPSPNDKFAGWAKRMGELQAEAYKIQYGWNKVSIVRPANVFGPGDTFEGTNAMVIPSLIKKASENDVLEVWGDGSPIRDFIYTDDVARGMVFAVEKGITEPINLGSGKGATIKFIGEFIGKQFNKPVKWDPTKPSGDAQRLFSMARANSYGFYPETSIDIGILKT
jgi:GDP-L-fucose synthase